MHLPSPVIEGLKSQREALRVKRSLLAAEKREIEEQLVALAQAARERDKRLRDSDTTLAAVDDAIKDAEQSYAKVRRGVIEVFRDIGWIFPES